MEYDAETLISFIFFHIVWLFVSLSISFCMGIQIAVLLQSNKEVTSNPYSSVYFIRLGILGILGIFGLSLVYALSRFFLLLT